MEDNEIAAKRHRKRKTYCFYRPFGSFSSQTQALKVVVASTILNNIQSEKARLRSARSVSPASLHCGRPYSADRGRHGSGEKSSQNSISRSHPFPQKSSKRYSESYFTPQTGPKPPMRFSPACGPCFRTEKTRKLIIWSGRRHVRTPSTEILLFSRHSREREEGIHRSGNAAAAWQTVLPHWLAAHLRRSQGQAGNEEKPAALHFCDQGGPALRPGESRSPNTHGTRHPRVLAAIGRGGPVGNYFHRAWKPIARHA